MRLDEIHNSFIIQINHPTHAYIRMSSNSGSIEMRKRRIQRDKEMLERRLRAVKRREEELKKADGEEGDKMLTFEERLRAAASVQSAFQPDLPETVLARVGRKQGGACVKSVVIEYRNAKGEVYEAKGDGAFFHGSDVMINLLVDLHKAYPEEVMDAYNEVMKERQVARYAVSRIL